jgi:Serine carboxypeptidase S28
MHASNIIFTNGDLDPWRAGGLLHDIPGNSDITVRVLEGGAHHLELRLPNPADPEDVVEARNLVEQHLVEWIRQYKLAPFPREVM